MPWWYHHIETLPILWSFREKNPLVINSSPNELRWFLGDLFNIHIICRIFESTNLMVMILQPGPMMFMGSGCNIMTIKFKVGEDILIIVYLDQLSLYVFDVFVFFLTIWRTQSKYRDHSLKLIPHISHLSNIHTNKIANNLHYLIGHCMIMR